MLMRVFLTMWVHESGHAVTAWLCGFPAFPMPWRTPMSETRSLLMTLLAAAAILGLIAWGVAKHRMAAICGGVMLLMCLICGTFMLSPGHALALVMFGGDGGALVLATVLISTVYVPHGGLIQSGWLLLGLSRHWRLSCICRRI